MARKAKQVRKKIIQRAGDQVSAEVVLSSESGSSMFETGAVVTASEQPGALQASRRTRHGGGASATGARVQGPSHRSVLHQR
jgi:hypothetical protein